MKSKLLSLALGALVAAGTAYAGTVVVSIPPADQPGRFRAITDEPANYPAYCLEIRADLDLNVPYLFEYGGPVIGGGGGAGPGGDPLSVGSAWLMQQFGRSATGAAKDTLQFAFWMLEDEMSWNPSNVFIQEVVSKFLSIADAKADVGANMGLYGVRVMNLTDDQRTDVQSLLIYVPDSGTSFILLGFGLGLIGLVSRRVRN